MSKQFAITSHYIDIAQHHLFLAICDSYGVSGSSVLNNFLREYNQMHYKTILSDPAATLAAKRCDPESSLDIFASLFLKLTPIQDPNKRRRGRVKTVNTELKTKMLNVYVSDICETKNGKNGKY
jgi:hypothetical protein